MRGLWLSSLARCGGGLFFLCWLGSWGSWVPGWVMYSVSLCCLHGLVFTISSWHPSRWHAGLGHTTMARRLGCSRIDLGFISWSQVVLCACMRFRVHFVGVCVRSHLLALVVKRYTSEIGEIKKKYIYNMCIYITYAIQFSMCITIFP